MACAETFVSEWIFWFLMDGLRGLVMAKQNPWAESGGALRDLAGLLGQLSCSRQVLGDSTGVCPRRLPAGSGVQKPGKGWVRRNPGASPGTPSCGCPWTEQNHVSGHL